MIEMTVRTVRPNNAVYSIWNVSGARFVICSR